MMSKIAESALDLVGNTPLLKLNRYSAEAGVKDATILGKLEYLNPAGSVKRSYRTGDDRGCGEEGHLKTGRNHYRADLRQHRYRTCSSCCGKGRYHAILTLPDTMSVERRNLLAAYGAELVLTEARV